MLELSDKESQDDHCDNRRHAQLQARLHEAKQIRSPVSDSRLLLLSHQILPTKPEGTELAFDAGLGGEIHVFALGYSPVKLDVYDAGGYPSALRSPFGLAFHDAPDEETIAGLNSSLRSQEIMLRSSRLVHTNPGDKLKIRVKGRGCTLVAAYHTF